MDNYLRGFGHALLLASATMWLLVLLATALGGCGTCTQDDSMKGWEMHNTICKRLIEVEVQ